MNILIEVVATNMDSGQIAISQETVELDKIPRGKCIELIKKLKESPYFHPKKVGPILITRSFISF